MFLGGANYLLDMRFCNHRSTIYAETCDMKVHLMLLGNCESLGSQSILALWFVSLSADCMCIIIKLPTLIVWPPPVFWSCWLRESVLFRSTGMPARSLPIYWSSAKAENKSVEPQPILQWIRSLLPAAWSKLSRLCKPERKAEILYRHVQALLWLFSPFIHSFFFSVHLGCDN